MAENENEETGARRRILDVASQLFAENGLDGTSVRDIAKQAGLNLSLVSYYFGGKEGLYLELIQNFASDIKHQIDRVSEMFEAESMSREKISEILLMLVKTYSGLRLSHPYMGKILQRERVAGLPFARDIYEKTFTPMGEALVLQMVKAQKKGFISKDINPLLIVIFLQESIIGFHNLMDCAVEMTQSPLGRLKNFKDFENQLVHIFMNGILS
jgi:AcrR family transcriptional regulator